MSAQRRKRIILIAIAVFAIAIGVHKHRQIRWAIAHALAQPLPISWEFTRFPVYQPSGIVADKKRGTLLAVSDKGQLFELDEQFDVLQRIEINGDLEGVDVHPETGTVFIASERSDTILEYDLDQHRILRTLQIDFGSDPTFANGVKPNKGVEGVAVVTSPTGEQSLFVAVEASPARIVQLSADVSKLATEAARRAVGADATTGLENTVGISAVYDVGLTRISDIAFDTRTGMLVLVSAGERVLMLADTDGRVSPMYRLPCKKPEGMCLLPNGDALVVDDTGGAWVLHGASGFLQEVAHELPSTTAQSKLKD